jgi:DNA-binding CsgD family transcriptional regulator
VAHASSLLADGDEGVEHGYVLITAAYEQLALGGDLDAAAADSDRAVETARRCGDPDLLVLGLTIQGRAMVRSGSIERGVVHLDEAVMVVEAGDVSPSIAGTALSSAIEAASEAFDSIRFGEWTGAFGRWRDLQEGMLAFQSRSLVYQATFDELQGRWDEALDAAVHACEDLGADPDPAAAAGAHYRQGDLLRLRGDLQEAEVAFREASRRGLDPQPGLALLRLAGGDVGAAVASIGRALGETRNPLKRAAMLPAHVEILLAAGNPTAASEAADELEKVADAHSTPVLEAAAHHARGAVLLAGGDPHAALGGLRVAARVWAHLGLPYEEARTRRVIAECCRMLGDDDASSLELGIARGIFSGLGARPDVVRVDSLLATQPPSSHGLSKRELEVLRLLAQGMTNKEIAGELIVAMRTVDSHVSHILTKLGVATRSAATAFAHRQNLL